MAAALLAGAPAAAASPGPMTAEEACLANAVSTVDMEGCQQHALAAARAGLGHALRQALARLAPDGRVRLRRQQAGWEAAGRSACGVPADSGTAGPLGAGQCLIDRTRSRARALESEGAAGR